MVYLPHSTEVPAQLVLVPELVPVPALALGLAPVFDRLPKRRCGMMEGADCGMPLPPLTSDVLPSAHYLHLPNPLSRHPRLIWQYFSAVGLSRSVAVGFESLAETFYLPAAGFEPAAVGLCILFLAWCPFLTSLP